MRIGRSFRRTFALLWLGASASGSIAQQSGSWSADTTRISALLQRADKFLGVYNIDSAGSCARRTMELIDVWQQHAPTIADTGRARVLALWRARTFMLLSATKGPDERMALMMEARRIRARYGDRAGLANIDLALAESQRNTPNFREGFANYRLAISEYDTLGMERAAITARNALGVAYREADLFSAAIETHLEALAQAGKLGDAGLVRNTNFLIGAVYRSKRDWPRALAYFTALRPQVIAAHDSELFATVASGLGNVYFGMGELDSSAKYMRLAGELHQRAGNINGVADIQSYMAGIHRQRGLIDKALESYAQAVATYARVPNLHGVATTYGEMATLEAAKGDRTAALHHLRMGLATMEALGRRVEPARFHLRIAQVLLAAGDREEALREYNAAIDLAAEMKIFDLLAVSHRELTDVYGSAGDDRSAYRQHQLYLAAKDSATAEAKSTRLMRLMMQHDIEQLTLKQHAEDEAERGRQQQEIETRRQEKNVYLAGGGLFVLFTIGLLGRLNQTARSRKRLEGQRRDLQRAKARAEESEKFKERFLANMSHEIRTPMNAIMGMTGIMRRNEHLPAQTQQLDAIALSAENLLRILNDILDLSKLDAGMVQLESTPMDPRAILDQVVSARRERARAKGGELVTSVAQEVPGMVMGDPTRLGQVLSNLLDNAIKFSANGAARVVLSAVKTGEHEVDLTFEVRDHGTGIPAGRLEEIFEEFTKAYSEGHQKYGGTGLGLTISKRLVELMGGSLGVASEEGQGSVFVVHLPFAIATSAGHRPSSVEVTVALRGLRILLAEDNAFNVMVVQDELQDAIPGVSIEVAANGREAVALVRANTFDVVLMDIQMPEMNGYDAAKAIRTLPGDKSRVPILAMTANGMKEEVDRCLEVGMDGYVPKPFKREELIFALQRVITTDRSDA